MLRAREWQEPEKVVNVSLEAISIQRDFLRGLDRLAVPFQPDAELNLFQLLNSI